MESQYSSVAIFEPSVANSGMRAPGAAPFGEKNARLMPQFGGGSLRFALMPERFQSPQMW
jgi:hypothetical protein